MPSLFPRLFPKKNQRAEEYAREQNEQKGEGYDPEKEPLEKGDFFAMVVSALLVIVPVAIGVLGVIILVGYLFLHLW